MPSDVARRVHPCFLAPMMPATCVPCTLDGTGGSSSVSSFSTRSQLIGRSLAAVLSQLEQDLVDASLRRQVHALSADLLRSPPRSLSLLSSWRTTREVEGLAATRVLPVGLSRNATWVAVDARIEHRPRNLAGLDVEQAAGGIGFHRRDRSIEGRGHCRFSETWKMTACAGSPISSDAICAYRSTSAATIAATSRSQFGRRRRARVASGPAQRNA